MSGDVRPFEGWAGGEARSHFKGSELDAAQSHWGSCWPSPKPARAGDSNIP